MTSTGPNLGEHEGIFPLIAKPILTAAPRIRPRVAQACVDTALSVSPSDALPPAY
jgi:hypothetical protein